MKKLQLLLILFAVLLTSAWAQSRPFVTEWRADTDGKLTFPVKGTNWKLEIWKGSTQIKNTTVSSSDEDNMFSVDGLTANQTYEVKMGPEGVEYVRSGWTAANDAAKQLLRVTDWGDVQWSSMEEAFAKCENLTAANIGQPKLENVTNCNKMFAGCKRFNSNLNTWDMTHVEFLEKIFDGCDMYNQPMQSWKLKNVKKISLGAVKTFSLANYEKTLIGWANNTETNTNVMFEVDALVYSSVEAKDAHDKLVNVLHWTIKGDEYLRFAFAQPQYYCAKNAIITVTTDFAAEIDKTKIKYELPGEYDEGYGVLKIVDKTIPTVQGLKDGKAKLTATLTHGAHKLKTTCEIVVNATGTKPTYTVQLSKSGTGEGSLNVRKTPTGEKLAMGNHTLDEGQKLYVNVDYNKAQAELELKVNGVNKTSLLDYGDAELEVKENLTVEAILTKIVNWKVEFETPQNGTMTVLGKNSVQLVAGKENLTPNGTLIITTFSPASTYELEAFRINKREENVGGGSHSFTLTQDVKLEAFFSKSNERSVVLEVQGNGDVMVEGTPLVAGINKVTKGSTQKITAKAKAGYELTTFSIDGVDKLAEAETGVAVTFNKVVDIKAAFDKKQETQKVRVNWTEPDEQMAEISVFNSDNQRIESGDEVTANTRIAVVVNPTEEYKLKELKVNGDDILPWYVPTEDAYYYTVGTVDATITYSFAKVELVTILFEAPNDTEGTFTVTDSKGTELLNEYPVEAGTKIYIKAAGKGNYKLTELKANGQDIRKPENWDETQKAYAYLVPKGLTTKEVTLTYKFEEKTIPDPSQTVKVRYTTPVAEEGTLVVFDADQNIVENEGGVKKNSTITIKAAPTSGYRVKTLKANDTDLLPTYNETTKTASFNVLEADVTIVVAFEKVTTPPPTEEIEVTLNVTGDLNGEVKVGEQALVAGINKVKKGETLKVTAKAKTGFQLKTFTIDGTDKLSEAETGVTITFNQAVTIAVAFEAAAQPSDSFTVTIVQPQDGTLVVKEGTKVLENGAKVAKTTLTIVATPNAKYELEWLKVNEEDLTAKLDKTTHSVQYEVKTDVKITAKFKRSTDVVDALFANTIVAPNPFGSQLRILNAEWQGAKYELINAQGVIVRTAQLGHVISQLDTEALPEGLYLLRLTHTSGATKTFVVIKK